MHVTSKRMSALVIWFGALVLATSCNVQAFGLKTHLWIGHQLLSEIHTLCRVDIVGVPIGVDPQVCQSLQSHPDAFLSGVLGPDAYPDVITGQVTAHPGIKGDWQTSDWLLHIYSKANSVPDLAFAAGYLVHAASDAFTHTYVNFLCGRHLYT